MQIRFLRALLLLVMALTLAAGSFAAESTGKEPAKTEPAAAAAKDTEVKVSVSAKDTKVREVLDSLAKQSKEKLIIESSVKGEVSSQSALSAVCKSSKMEWRKIYIAEDSKLLEQPDRLAATVRLMSGLSFPDMVLAGSSLSKVAVHFGEKNAVQKAEASLPKELGMVRVYLITNDAATLARALAKENEAKKNSESAAVQKYADIAQEQMDMFMKMTPEEREQALVSNLNMMDQVGPEYMSAVMQTMMNIDPENLRRLVSKQTEMLFSMSPEQRRSMMRFNIEAMKMITPEQQKMLQEDAMALMEEMKSQTGK